MQGIYNVHTCLSSVYCDTCTYCSYNGYIIVKLNNLELNCVSFEMHFGPADDLQLKEWQLKLVLTFRLPLRFLIVHKVPVYNRYTNKINEVTTCISKLTFKSLEDEKSTCHHIL